MPNLEKKIIIGHIGKTIEVKCVGHSGLMAKFSVAVNHYSKNNDNDDGDGFDKITKWHNVVAFGRAADVIKDASKGELVYVDGDVKYRYYTSSDGEQKVYENINASKIILFNKYGGLIARGDSYDPRERASDACRDDEVPF